VPALTKSPSDLSLSPQSRHKAILSFWPMILSGMLALLAVLAFLQYRWTNDATAAYEMRIGAELESLMVKWHGDLYGEFSAICTAMQVGPDSGARDTWNDYLDRYVEWNNALPHETLPNVYRNPDLVQTVYIWDTNLDAQPQLFRLNEDKKKIEIAQVPQNLQALLARLRAHSTSLSTSLHVWQLSSQGERTSSEVAPVSSSPSVTTNSGWQFDEDIPAIVHPIFQRDGRTLNSQSPVDWMVIVLDLDALRKRILPELATRYFGGLEGLDYKVAVIAKGAQPEAIYSSDPGFGTQDIDAADASLNIFGSAEDVAQPHIHQSRNAGPFRSREWHNFYGSVWFPVIEYDSHPSPWILVVQRRASPLQAVINGVRRKNLALSAFVLLLLALTMALLTMAGIRAQKFNKLQMDFVASVSHELRTPLTAIFSAAENIRDGVISDKSNLADYGSMVMGQSRHLMDYVDRILLFASMRSGKDRYNIRPLQISDILQRVRKNMASLIIEESCIIEENIQPGLPFVLGDLLAACGCLENLITNAIKYGGIDRRIRISAHLQTTESRKEVAISIQDRGMGIHSSELKQIFEPFYRSPEATLAQIPGTGLGLSVCKHLAEAMGGRLSVKSEVGVGSIFTLHLQTAESQPGEFTASSSTKGEGYGE
jgi:signal transduction histidine kinase